MSVFFLNTCKFNGCGITFSTLQELIYHIEDTHLDFEPKNIDENEFKQTSCMPVSYIFRLFSGEYRSPIKPTNLNVTLNNSRKDSGSELDEENYESESEKSSIDSWSNNSIESDSNTVLKIINASKSVQNKQDDSEKPYICQFTNCKKRYRNSNGLKYHTKSVHTENGIKKELAPPRMYRCVCNKNYKTIYGLKNHAKTCNTNLAQSNPIGKLTESSTIKATVITSNKNGSTTSNNSINSNNNGLLTSTKPIVSVSIATTNILPLSPPKSNETTTDTIDNQMQEDESEDNLISNSKTCSIKAPTLQHLLSPIN